MHTPTPPATPAIYPLQGTEKSEECLHIFLEYVPGGSIASLLARFGCFRESVIRVYTKQIMAGLEYLHRWVRCGVGGCGFGVGFGQGGKCKCRQLGIEARRRKRRECCLSVA